MLLVLAMESRRRVREHLLRIDDTFKRHNFTYRPVAGGPNVTVHTPEEIQYPTFAGPKAAHEETGVKESAVNDDSKHPGAKLDEISPQPSHIVVPENTKGWSYRRLFAQYLKGARSITINDPYVRLFFQARNLMEFLQMVHHLVPEGDEVSVHLVTQSDRDTCEKQAEHLNQMVEAFTGSKVAFTWELDHSPNFHARSITTDTGWKITIDRGLDIFQKFETGPFSLEQAIQEARLTRGAEITYLKA